MGSYRDTLEIQKLETSYSYQITMISSLFNKSILLSSLVYLLLVGVDTSFATNLQIDTTNYSRYLATQEGVFSTT